MPGERLTFRERNNYQKGKSIYRFYICRLTSVANWSGRDSIENALRSNQMSKNGGSFADWSVQEEKSTEDHCPLVRHSRDIVTTELQIGHFHSQIKNLCDVIYRRNEYIVYTYVPKPGACSTARKELNLPCKYRA